MDQDLFSKASVRTILNEMAGAFISASQRFFLGGIVKNSSLNLIDCIWFCCYCNFWYMYLYMFLCCKFFFLAMPTSDHYVV